MEHIKNRFPLVSVVASCYNQAQFVIESLNSIKAQTYSNLELIIWDDCSSDNSVNLIEHWIENNDLEVVFIKHTKNLGVCKSLNEAFSYVRGKYIQIIALDDVLLQDKIYRHVEVLEKSEDDVALVFSDAYLMDSDSNLFQNKFIAYSKPHYLSIESGFFFDDLIVQNFIPAMSVLYKVDVLRECGLWDEELLYEDYDMLLRLSQNYKFLYDIQITVKYRFHGSNYHSTLEQNKKYFDSEFLMFSKYLDNHVAREKVVQLLYQMYMNRSKNIYLYSEIFFAKNKPNTFFLKCLKRKIPLFIYLFLDQLRIIREKYFFVK